MVPENAITALPDCSRESSMNKGMDDKIDHVESQQWNAIDLDKHTTQDDRQLHVTSDEKARSRYLWKLDFLILPTISACYFFEYLDRGNVAVRLIPPRTRGFLTDTYRMQNCSVLVLVMILPKPALAMENILWMPYNGRSSL